MKIQAYALTAALIASLASPHPGVAQGSWDEYQIAATMASQPLVLDGLLDDVVWADATAMSAFVQQEPNEGAPATERTEIRVMYDAQNLYIGVPAFDASGIPPRVTEMRRDSDDPEQTPWPLYRLRRSAHMRANAIVMVRWPPATISISPSPSSPTT